ncbi:MAG: sugar ABC transporter permease [Planctomycetota bacterium]|nr:MAG: sugar ABC transporter permease [Planctomycetota bacterium]
MEKGKKWKENLVAYGLLSPFLLLFTVFLAFPIFYSLWLSLHKATLFTSWYHPFSDMKYVGLAHYKEILTSSEFWWSLFLTLCYGFLTIPTGIFVSLLLALLLHNKLPGKNFLRSAYFLPNVLDLFVLGTIWVMIFSPKYGLLDQLFRYLGIVPFIEDGLLGNPWTVLPAIAFVMVLKGAGFGMILFLTAIQNISPSLYEAAEIDGATWWQKTWHITIPLVKPITIFLVITGTIACLTAFTEVYAMTSNTGGPTVQVFGRTLKSANLIGYYLYRNFADAFYGRAAALSFILLGIALVISALNMMVLQERRQKDVEKP